MNVCFYYLFSCIYDSKSVENSKLTLNISNVTLQANPNAG